MQFISDLFATVNIVFMRSPYNVKSSITIGRSEVRKHIISMIILGRDLKNAIVIRHGANKNKLANELGAVHTERPQSGGRSLSSADFFRTRKEEVLQMRTSALFGVKNFRFFEIYGVFARTRRKGISQCGQEGKGVNFSRFCADFLYGRLFTRMTMILTLYHHC